MSVYLLYNQKKDVKLFIEADGYEEAVKTFKACKFKNSFENKNFNDPVIKNIWDLISESVSYTHLTLPTKRIV